MTEVTHYPWTERMLHRVAFAGLGMQQALADIEQRLFKIDTHQPIQRPVFITSLPRAGTTLLLQLLSGLSECVAHTYRQMPFVMCPVLWDRLSRPFRKSAQLKERAHGDGMKVGFDSPEAFEEILWQAFWPEHYQKTAITAWQGSATSEEFSQFFQAHINSLLSLYHEQHPMQAHRRYLSKNNANIARLKVLSTLFPDCQILIPLRDPWQHAESMRRQHERFVHIHREDPFALRYMNWLGHYEFGAALRPIHFSDRDRDLSGLDPLQLPFWLTYWLNAYSAITSVTSSHITFVDYEQLCTSPEAQLQRLATVVAPDEPEQLLAQADTLHAAPHYVLDIDRDAPLSQAVNSQYQSLLQRCC